MPDKHEVGGSSPLGPTIYAISNNSIKFLWLPFFSKKVTTKMLIENRIKKRNEQIVVYREKLVRRNFKVFPYKI